MPLHDVATLTEAFRRAVLKMIVNRELMDIETAEGMLKWPHSGFHTHDGVWASADDTHLDALTLTVASVDDKEFTIRLARYCPANADAPADAFAA